MGPVKERADAEIAKARARIQAAARNDDYHLVKTFFKGDAIQGYKLRDAALTGEEHEALKALREGKDIPKKALDSDNPELLAGGGSVEVVQRIAAKCKEFGI